MAWHYQRHRVRGARIGHGAYCLGPSNGLCHFRIAARLPRRYAAKLSYELELHSGAPLDALPDRYAQLLSAAVGVPCPPSDCLEDVDGGFYCTCYLRAWAFEAQLAEWLRGEYGSAWFRQRPAGSLVRELWELGQSLDADALLREVTGDVVDFDVLADQARSALG